MAWEGGLKREGRLQSQRGAVARTCVVHTPSLYEQVPFRDSGVKVWGGMRGSHLHAWQRVQVPRPKFDVPVNRLHERTRFGAMPVSGFGGA